MKRWLILFPLCCLMAADIEDIGLVTPRKPIVLEAGENDIDHFIVRVYRTGSYQTNDITFTNRTGILTVNGELRDVYPGKQMFEVTSIFKDGDASEPSRFTFELRRSRPKRPTAKAVGIESTPLMPPMPPGMVAPYVSPAPIRVQPLPGGTNTSYEQFQLRFKNEIAEGNRRRSQ